MVAFGVVVIWMWWMDVFGGCGEVSELEQGELFEHVPFASFQKFSMRLSLLQKVSPLSIAQNIS